jgi:hypothetical protein
MLSVSLGRNSFIKFTPGPEELHHVHGRLPAVPLQRVLKRGPLSPNRDLQLDDHFVYGNF